MDERRKMISRTRRRFLTDSLLLTGSMLVPSRRLRGLSGDLSKGEEPAVSYPSYLSLHEKGILSERVKELQSMYESCTLCPRDCRVNRKKKQKGKCQATSNLKVSNAFPHFGEEPPLVGQKGSGTVFFSNCGVRCVFCQNYEISIEGEGIEIPDERLAESMIKLQKMGCHNINLVTPTHYVPNIVNALEMAVGMGLKIPLVYNTSGYEKLETLKLLDGIIDIYLPDFKYMDPEKAAKYSDQAYSYPHYARIALKEIHRQVGELVTTGKGVALKGLIIRHLILPNRIAGTREFLKFVSEELSKNTCINLMRQYRPEYRAKEFPDIARRINRKEYEETLGWAGEFGLTNLAR